MHRFQQNHLDRALFLIYKSVNECMFVNYIPVDMPELIKFCKNKEAKEDLVKLLRDLADEVERSKIYNPEI